MRFSLREIFFITTIAALAMPMLCFANAYTRGAAVAVTMLVLFAATIRALVDRGDRQATAIGFAATAGLYVAVVLLTGSGKDVHPNWSRFPTIQVLQSPLTWIQQQRGPKDTKSSPFGAVQLQNRPAATHFTPIAHCLWTLLFGYLGGKYAVHVYTRRVQREQNSRNLGN